MRMIHAYDATLSRSRARADVSRTLHDGVLQTLAVIERRSDDPELASLAREQERELRAFLSDEIEPAGALGGSGRRRVTSAELQSSMRKLVSRQLRHTATRATVFVAEDVPPMSSARAEALLGAVAEALANVAKHASATTVTVFAEPAGRSGVFCSVKDDGVGFDISQVGEGFGITNSIRRRMTDVGGRVEVVARAGGGAEVRLWT
jgi:signal transduction histidine kinase